jgi:hypothetical protein
MNSFSGLGSGISAMIYTYNTTIVSGRVPAPHHYFFATTPQPTRGPAFPAG